jgi:[NiFe] hydrogenase assembly HybE family chaperone
MTATASDLLDMRVQALVALYRDIAATRMRGLPLLNPDLQVQAVGFELVQEAATVQPAPPDAATGLKTAGAGIDMPCIQSFGTHPQNPESATAGVGVLITPWFMNLVWLPLQRLDAAAHVGSKMTRHVGQECFEFIGAHENGFGGYEACSLFSPVFEFQSQQAAVETARAVLDTLRQPATAPAVLPPPTTATASSTATVPVSTTQAAPVAVPVPPARDKTSAPGTKPSAKSGAMPAATPAQSLEIPQAPARRAFLFGRSAAAGEAARPAVQPPKVSSRG